MKSKTKSNTTEIRQKALKLTDKPITLGNHINIANPQHTVNSLLDTYDGAKTPKQVERFQVYFNLAVKIVNKCLDIDNK